MNHRVLDASRCIQYTIRREIDQTQSPRRRHNVTKNEVVAQIKTIVEDRLNIDPDEIAPSTHFIEDLGADSLDLVDLVAAFEEKFEFSIPDSEAEQLATVDAVADYILSKQ
jgi:acyl carrier protein